MLSFLIVLVGFLTVKLLHAETVLSASESSFISIILFLSL